MTVRVCSTPESSGSFLQPQTPKNEKFPQSRLGMLEKGLLSEVFKADSNQNSLYTQTQFEIQLLSFTLPLNLSPMRGAFQKC